MITKRERVQVDFQLLKMVLSLSIPIRHSCGFVIVAISSIILRITYWILKEKQHFNAKATGRHLEEPHVFLPKRQNASDLLSGAILLLFDIRQCLLNPAVDTCDVRAKLM